MSNKYDERYRGTDFYYGTEPNDFLREQVGCIAPGGKVLCLAEGEGRNAVFLAAQGFAVTAVDANAYGLEKLQVLAKSRAVNVTGICVDLADYDFGSSAWDAIVSIFCHLPPALRESVHRRALLALKPGGVFILEAYRPEQVGAGTGGPPDPALCISREILADDFAALHWQLCESTQRAVLEGRGHTGVGAVIRFVGVRSLQQD